MKGSLKATAETIVQDKLGLSSGKVAFTSGYSSELADYAYLKQTHVCNFALSTLSQCKMSFRTAFCS